MSLTDINQKIDLCLLAYIPDIRDVPDITDIADATEFDTEEVSIEVYNVLNNNAKIYNKNNIKDNSDKIYTYDVVNKRVAAIKQYRSELKVLLQLPLMKQRTVEWFDARKTRLTASDLYDAIKGGNVSIRLAKKKANIVIDNINYNAIPALKWGTMFEPMATRCYSQKMNDIVIHDFGLICDIDNKHFGASPDGINELGIMLEIKCPYSRKIMDGVIPDKYRMQIQGQLAVCKLKECDYIECIFKSIEDEEDYLELDNTIKHGVIAEFYNSKGEYVYYYSEPNQTPKECLEEIKNNRNNYINEYSSANAANAANAGALKFSKYTYWKLDEMIIQRVIFNADEWINIIPKINAFWETVEEYKMLPIEIGIKKYKFVDDDEEDNNTEAKSG
jgi:putative phage-type endonuclease